MDEVMGIVSDVADKLTDRGAQRVMFYMGTMPDGEASVKEGRPIYKEVPFIKIFTAGDNLHVHEVPVWDDPSNLHSHTSRFKAEWKAFKAGVTAEEQTQGTPLKLMPGIKPGHVRELEHFHVKTIEQLAEISDEHGGKFMGIQALKQQARAFVLAAKGAAPMKQFQRELEMRDKQIAILQEQLQELLAGKAKPADEVDVLEGLDDGVPTSALAKPAGKKAPSKRAARS